MKAQTSVELVVNVAALRGDNPLQDITLPAFFSSP